jgi:hypothetical protein
MEMHSWGLSSVVPEWTFMARNTLTLTVKGSITLDIYHKTVGRFFSLIKALSEEIASGTPITWRLVDLQIGSTSMTIAGEAMQPELVERTTRAYASVGTALAFGEPVPYSARVNRCALALSQVITGEVTALEFTTDLGSVLVPQAVGIASPGKRLQAWGTVDGTVETLTSHRRLAFILYEAHFGYPVRCIVRHEQEAIMLQMWRKFVRVSGLVIRAAQSGHPLEIRDIGEIRELQVSASDNYRKAAGILDLGGEAPEVLIRKLRDATP